MLLLPDWFRHLEVQWEEPASAHVLECVGEFAHVFMLNLRGIGLSGPVDPDHLPSLHEWCDDVIAVARDLGVESMSVVAAGGAGPLAIELACHPDVAVDRLVLLGTTARFREAPDYTIGIGNDMLDMAADVTRELWGSGRLLDLAAPDRILDRSMRDWYARSERHTASPDVAGAMQRAIVDFDVRDRLPAVSCPTIVIHRRDDQVIPLTHGCYLAEHLPDATLIELPGTAHLCFGDSPKEWLDELRAFHTGTRASAQYDRRIVTLLFTDIVESTVLANKIGDARWREVLEKHDRMAAVQVKSHGGVVVDIEGDGVLARFDSPADAINAARALGSEFERLGIAVRAGVHTGEVELREDDDLAGISVHIGARVATAAAPGEVMVSRTVRDLLFGSHFEFDERGSHTLRGVPGEWELFAVTPPQP